MIRHLGYGFLFILCGCVSVRLPQNQIVKSKDVQFEVPPRPFHEIEAKGADKAWQNSKTGNTVAFYSECGNPADIPLERMQVESLSALSQMNVLKSTPLQFNEREGLEVLAEGFVDGVPIQMQLVLFKKNGCSYSLTYVGRKLSFAHDLARFLQFTQTFRAP